VNQSRSVMGSPDKALQRPRQLGEGADRVGGLIDLDALVAYVKAHSPVAPGPQNRIIRID
jgi:hypothetical protein